MPGLKIALTPVTTPGLDAVPPAGGTLTTSGGGGVLVVLGTATGAAPPAAGAAVSLSDPAGPRTWTVRSTAPATAARAAALAAAPPASGLVLLIPVSPGEWLVVVA